MQDQRQKKRRLMDSQEETMQLALQSKRHRSSDIQILSHSQIRDEEVCARLLTTTRAGRKEAAVISIEKPVTIGRNPAQWYDSFKSWKQRIPLQGTASTYVIRDPVVSNVHLKVYAIRSTTGAILLSCQDFSTNGIKLNNYLIKKSSIILTHGDILKIPSSQTFKCIYTIPFRGVEKKTLFDPTPPLVPVDKTVGKYRVTSYTLGSGTYATVNLAYTIQNTSGVSTYKQVACKMLRVTSEAEKTKLMREVELLKGLNHANINRILDAVVKDGFLNVFLDLSTGGDLFTYISSRDCGRVTEGEARYCGFQLMLGLRYLHDRSVSHRDLKPENILLHTPGPFPRLIIADFGLARPRAHEQTLNAVGTICYMPPEAVLALTAKNMGYVGIYADAWSLGLVLFTMLCGYNPFDCDEDGQTHHHSRMSPFIQASQSHLSGRSDAIMMSRIVNSSIEFRDVIWHESPDAQDLIGRLLIHNPKDRETVRGALSSRWILRELQALKERYRDGIGPCV